MSYDDRGLALVLCQITDSRRRRVKQLTLECVRVLQAPDLQVCRFQGRVSVLVHSVPIHNLGREEFLNLFICLSSSLGFFQIELGRLVSPSSYGTYRAVVNGALCVSVLCSLPYTCWFLDWRRIPSGFIDMKCSIVTTITLLQYRGFIL